MQMFQKFRVNIPRRIPTRPKLISTTNQVERKEVYESVTQVIEESRIIHVGNESITHRSDQIRIQPTLEQQQHWAQMSEAREVLDETFDAFQRKRRSEPSASCLTRVKLHQIQSECTKPTVNQLQIRKSKSSVPNTRAGKGVNMKSGKPLSRNTTRTVNHNITVNTNLHNSELMPLMLG